jgi:hypothetical protein
MTAQADRLDALRTRLEDERRRLVLALAADPVLSFLPMLSGVQAALDALDAVALELVGPAGAE